MKKKKILSLISFAYLALVATSCDGLDGDNSDFNFNNRTEDTVDPYKDGYGRLPNSIRLGTYNVHRCEGPGTQDPNIDRAIYAKTADVIARLDPDVYALQELDYNTSWHPVNQLEKLATLAGGMYYTGGPAIDYKGGKYGNGILSKTAPTAIDNFILPNPKATEQRACAVAEFSNLIFLATHFCHKEGENRTAQAKAINDYVGTKYPTETRPIFLAGDLNEASSTSEMMTELLKKWKIISTSSFTTGAKRIDYVLIYTGNTATCEVIGTAVPNWGDLNIATVSDHNPVIVDIKK